MSTRLDESVTKRRHSPLPPWGRGEQIANVGEAGAGGGSALSLSCQREMPIRDLLTQSPWVSPLCACAPAGMTDEKQSPLPPPQCQITHIRVGFAFPAEIANLAMARHKVDVIAIRPELAGDGGD